ncbi:hypothetical protein T440DRAFT_514201 [Plenodomus tracheiphilus IPT5]|uniref:Uncharacterized protein n=1 Tax=Plenodomus tracheiphilus IPT5 TaxID=1408161 RepID=A0A6A7BLZ6_9PLEO|nr:hypothetical protein T440DRAFT_514201 [Plenodomus tracheiphilus IPT5]
MLFPLYWAMSVHREPLWFEIKFDNFLNWLTERVSAPFRGTALEWWLLHPEGQTFTQVLTVMFAVCIWCFALDGSLWGSIRTFLTNSDAADNDDDKDDDTEVTGSFSFSG